MLVLNTLSLAFVLMAPPFGVSLEGNSLSKRLFTDLLAGVKTREIGCLLDEDVLKRKLLNFFDN